MQAVSMLDTKKYLLELRNYLTSEEYSKKMEGVIRGKGFCDYLIKQGIPYEVCIKHPEVKGCSESACYYERFQDYLPFDYSICKHLLVHERKGEKRTFLIIVDSNKIVDLNGIREELDCKKLEFAKEEEMNSLLGTTPGNVSIFNMMNDKEKKVQLVIDQELLEKETLAFHPLYNGMSLFMKPESAFQFLDLIGREALVLDLKEKATENKETIEMQKIIAC